MFISKGVLIRARCYSWEIQLGLEETAGRIQLQFLHETLIYQKTAWVDKVKSETELCLWGGPI